jgi:hypothetical protein
MKRAIVALIMNDNRAREPILGYLPDILTIF